MKINDKPGKDEKSAAKSIRNYIKTDEELVSLLLTYMGSMSIMLDFLAETYGKANTMKLLPQRVKYAVSMAISQYRTLGLMIREEIPEGDLKCQWMDIREDAWTAKDELTARMVQVVKYLYEELKEEGKI